MAQAPRENYDYAAISKNINRKYDPRNFEDLRGVSGAAIAYDPKQSPTDNIQRFLAERIYNGDKDKAYHHAFDVFRALHEQTLVQKYEHGFNDFADKLRAECTSIELQNGKLRFVGRGGALIGEFESASSARKDLESRVAERRDLKQEVGKSQVRTFTKKGLAEVLPEFSRGRLKLPDYKASTFSLPPSFFRESGLAPALIDETRAGETVCAAYVTEVERYYLGSKRIEELGMENRDAWFLRQQLLGKKAVTVDASMAKFLHLRRGRPTFEVAVRLPNGRMSKLHGDKAKEQPYYGVKYREFYRVATGNGKPPEKAPTKDNVPPGLITLFFHGTAHAADVARANARDGANSLNSHVVVNLGETKTKLPLGAFRKGTGEKSVADVLKAHFPRMNPKFNWAFLDGKQDARKGLSRVYLNGKQLLYSKGEFLQSNGAEARVREGDTLEWEDVMITDRFHDKNRVVGLTELMMTGQYEVVDLMNFKNAKPLSGAEKPAVQNLRDLPSYATRELMYIKPGRTLAATLKERGVRPEEITYHLYAYEKIGLRPEKIRPYDPLPAFDTSALVKDVKDHGGIGKVLAAERTAHAEEYMKKHPGEFLFIVQSGQSPDAFVTKLCELPQIAALGKLTGKERQFIVIAIMAANRGVAINIDERGRVLGASRWDAGAEIFVNNELLGTITHRIEGDRARHEVFIPEKLPGGPRLKAPEYSSEERDLILKATNVPHVRSALALVLAMEQKQETFSWRATKKSVYSALGGTINSVGLFQVRVAKEDLDRYKRATGNPAATLNDLRRAADKNQNLNADITATRLEKLFDDAARIYEFHGEHFDPMSEGCMSFVLNCYHASANKVLDNVFAVWTHDLGDAMKHIPALANAVPAEDKTEKRVAAVRSAGTNFIALARALKDSGEIVATDMELANVESMTKRNRGEFMASPLLKNIEKWYEEHAGRKLSLNVAPTAMDNPEVKMPFLTYGIRATRYGTLKEVEAYSKTLRRRDHTEPPQNNIVASIP